MTIITHNLPKDDVAAFIEEVRKKWRGKTFSGANKLSDMTIRDIKYTISHNSYGLDETGISVDDLLPMTVRFEEMTRREFGSRAISTEMRPAIIEHLVKELVENKQALGGEVSRLISFTLHYGVLGPILVQEAPMLASIPSTFANMVLRNTQDPLKVVREKREIFEELEGKISQPDSSLACFSNYQSIVKTAIMERADPEAYLKSVATGDIVKRGFKRKAEPHVPENREKVSALAAQP